MKSFGGFTLIELMVTIAIISLFASTVATGMQFVREKAQDTIRVHEVGTLAKALIAHEAEFGHWIENGYGEHDGNGYVNVPGATTNGPAMVERLVESGHLEREIVDPSGAIGSSEERGYNGYMKYHCPLPPERPTAIYVYARLAGEPLSDTATDGTCCPDCDSLYNMNYYQLIPARDL